MSQSVNVTKIAYERYPVKCNEDLIDTNTSQRLAFIEGALWQIENSINTVKSSFANIQRTSYEATPYSL